MNQKLTLDKICEWLIYIYTLIVMASPTTGTIIVKGIRLILFAILIIRIIKKQKLYKSWYAKWAIIFMLYNIIMIHFSYNKTISVKYTFSLIYVLVINILICQFIVEKKIFINIFKTIIAGSLIKSVLIFAKNGMMVFLTARSTQDASANTIGIYSALAFILCYYLNKNTDNHNKKIKYNVLLIIFILFTILSASRKAVLILIIPVVIYNIVKSKDPLKVIINMLVILIILSCVMYAVFNVKFIYDLVGNRIESMISGFLGGETDGSTYTRMYLIEEGIEWFKQKPLVGYGPAVYRVLHASKHGGNLLYAHNNYIELLVDLGLIGTIIYYALYVKILFSCIKSLKKSREYFILFGLFLAIVISEYGFVTYYEATIQFTLMIILMFFDKVNKNETIE